MVSKQIKKLIEEVDREHSINNDEALLLLALAKTIKAKTIVEIGTAYGYSAIWLASSGAEVYTVDIPKRAKLSKENRQAKKNIKKTNNLGLKIDFSTIGSEKFLRNFNGEIDLLFIDGWHQKEQVKKELKLAKKNLYKNSVIVLHDTAKFDLGYKCNIPSKIGMTILRKDNV